MIFLVRILSPVEMGFNNATFDISDHIVRDIIIVCATSDYCFYRDNQQYRYLIVNLIIFLFFFFCCLFKPQSSFGYVPHFSELDTYHLSPWVALDIV